MIENGDSTFMISSIGSVTQVPWSMVTCLLGYPAFAAMVYMDPASREHTKSIMVHPKITGERRPDK